jgi:bacterioferritin-associated ferredoxin
MIVCSCNAFSDGDVKYAMANAARRVSQVYTSIGCTPQCGRCARTVKQILDEAASNARRRPALAAAQHAK